MSGRHKRAEARNGQQMVHDEDSWASVNVQGHLIGSLLREGVHGGEGGGREN